MEATQNAANTNEYRNLPVTALVESANNPRKRFDEKSLEELAAHVSGHISCLLCRSPFCARRQQTEYLLGGALFEGHITCNGGTCPSDAAVKAR
jgi:hypothetical protein